MAHTRILGDALVKEGLINQTQLQKSLSVHISHPTKSLGEILSKLYGIAEGKVEAIFVQNILLPAIRNFLYAELQKKINNPDFDLAKEVPSMEIKIRGYQRVTIASKSFTYENDLFYGPATAKHFLFRIDCTIEAIVMRTVYADTLEFKEVFLEFDLQNQRVTLENPSIIMEAKIKLNQITKGRKQTAT
jgi:hypothetical protein